MASRAAQPTVPSPQTTSARLGSTVLAIRWVFPSPRGQLSLLQAPRLLPGRDDDCQIQLPGTETSRQHAEIRRDGLLHTIRDLASTNGVFVNGEQVREAPIGPGRVLRLGDWIGGHRFAIKFLHAYLAQNPETMTRFRHEAETAGGIEHENIGAALDFGTADDGTPYLVMEYLEGEDLARLLVRNGPLPVARATYIIIQACRGLTAAHARGIVHRDLKPENLFICRRNDGGDLVKVVDFGIAKLRTKVTVTQSGVTMGTPCYMSMEQAKGAKEVDERTDIYSLGVILYEILTGARPYPGENYNEVLYNLFTTEPVPLDTLRPGVPAGLCEVVNRAMAREARNRFESAAALADALVPFAGRPVTPLQSQVMESGFRDRQRRAP